DSVACTGLKEPCPCADILYKLSSGEDLFAVNGTTGEVYITAPNKLQANHEYGLTVRALAKGPVAEEKGFYDEFHLNVVVQEVLGRAKRQISRKNKNKAAETAVKS